MPAEEWSPVFACYWPEDPPWDSRKLTRLSPEFGASAMPGCRNPQSLAK